MNRDHIIKLANWIKENRNSPMDQLKQIALQGGSTEEEFNTALNIVNLSEPSLTQYPVDKNKFSIREAIDIGWKMVKSNFLFYIFLSIITLIISLPLGFIASFLPPSLWYFTSIIIPILSYSLNALIIMGIQNISIHTADGEKGKYSGLFSKYRLFLKYIANYIVIGLITLGGYVLFIVPGIIWTIEFSLAGFFIVDQGIGPIEAIKRSSVTTSGIKKKLFLFDFFLFLVLLLGLLALGIGLFIALPVVFVAQAYVYRKLQTQTVQRNNNYYSSGFKFFNPAKILGLIIGTVVFCAILINSLFPQLFISYTTHILVPKTKMPVAYVIPVERTRLVSKTDLSTYPEFTYYGISFRSPWKTFLKETIINETVSLEFSQDHEIIFSQVKEDISLSMTKNLSTEDLKKAEYLLGKEVLSSNYNMFTEIMKTSPDQITLFTPSQEAVKISILSIIKTPLASPVKLNDNAISSFDVNGIKGYQFGTPGISNKIFIQLFDKNDKMYAFLIKGNDITQGDIDLILSSVKLSNNVVNSSKLTKVTSLNLPTITPTTQIVASTPSPNPTPASIQIEDNVTLQIMETSSDEDYIFAKFKFTNNSSQAISINPRISLRSQTHGAGGEDLPVPDPYVLYLPATFTLGSGQSKETQMRFMKLSNPPFVFYYLSSKDKDIVIGLYSP